MGTLSYHLYFHHCCFAKNIAHIVGILYFFFILIFLTLFNNFEADLT